MFAALETATGKITADACYPRHRHQEFLTFLQKVAATHPELDLHVVLDNYGTRKHPEIRRWLARPENQRITLHLTPTSCSWLSMVEVFGIITRQTIGRGSFGPVRELTDAIGALIDGCQPFTWIKDADQLLASKKLMPRGTSIPRLHRTRTPHRGGRGCGQLRLRLGLRLGLAAARS